MPMHSALSEREKDGGREMDGGSERQDGRRQAHVEFYYWE